MRASNETQIAAGVIAEAPRGAVETNFVEGIKCVMKQ
jgi:hypothetical protein